MKGVLQIIRYAFTIRVFVNRFVLFTFLCSCCAYGQPANSFEDEVAQISQKYDSVWDSSKETIVFTGSSSVRIWENLENEFPNHYIVNTGFGGSKASDLLFFSEDLILRFKPKKVFIYEGDNDIAAHEKPNEVIETTAQIIDRIKRQNTATEIVLISAKPSIARWHLRRKYRRLNRRLKKLAKNDVRVAFVDVWTPMLVKRKVIPDVFLSDGLHMNADGYRIWRTALLPFVN